MGKADFLCVYFVNNKRLDWAKICNFISISIAIVNCNENRININVDLIGKSAYLQRVIVFSVLYTFQCAGNYTSITRALFPTE